MQSAYFLDKRKLDWRAQGHPCKEERPREDIVRGQSSASQGETNTADTLLGTAGLQNCANTCVVSFKPRN